MTPAPVNVLTTASSRSEHPGTPNVPITIASSPLFNWKSVIERLARLAPIFFRFAPVNPAFKVLIDLTAGTLEKSTRIPAAFAARADGTIAASPG